MGSTDTQLQDVNEPKLESDGDGDNDNDNDKDNDDDDEDADDDDDEGDDDEDSYDANGSESFGTWVTGKTPSLPLLTTRSPPPRPLGPSIVSLDPCTARATRLV